MEPVYIRIRKCAHEIASRFPDPSFYHDLSWANQISMQFFDTDPIISELRIFVSEHLEDDFGHGLEHAIKVSLDAGAIVIVESKNAGYSMDLTERELLKVQSAGLLHDIKRKQKNHALKGADSAEQVLKSYPFLPEEVAMICQAIRNHEAFKDIDGSDLKEDSLVSNCLYDGDKFRWGPDNFTDTIWDMVSFFKTPISKFIAHYPQGMEGLAKIKQTFRTDTGKKYGPQFINTGISIGEELFRVINTEFCSYL